MVPFYGQGMNAGFEDVRMLFEFINKYPNLEEAFENYSKERMKDAHSINDLAMKNYVEMRDSVTSRLYLARKRIEELLYDWFPWLGVRTQYNMVSFSTIRYHQVIKRVERQTRVLKGVVSGLGIGCIVAVMLVGRRLNVHTPLLRLGADVWKTAAGGLSQIGLRSQ